MNRRRLVRVPASLGQPRARVRRASPPRWRCTWSSRSWRPGASRSRPTCRSRATGATSCVRGVRAAAPARRLRRSAIRSDIPLSRRAGDERRGATSPGLRGRRLTSSSSTPTCSALATRARGPPDNVAAALHGRLRRLRRRPRRRASTPPAGPRGRARRARTQPVRTAQGARRAARRGADGRRGLQRRPRLAARCSASRAATGTSSPRGLDDRLHQPRRAHLYPRSMELVERARELGALGATISGAGPTVLVWCHYEQTGAVVERAARRGRRAGRTCCACRSSRRAPTCASCSRRRASTRASTFAGVRAAPARPPAHPRARREDPPPATPVNRIAASPPGWDCARSAAPHPSRRDIACQEPRRARRSLERRAPQDGHLRMARLRHRRLRDRRQPRDARRSRPTRRTWRRRLRPRHEDRRQGRFPRDRRRAGPHPEQDRRRPTDPAYRAAVRDVERRLAAQTATSRNIKSPYAKGNAGQISRDGHSAARELRDRRRLRTRRRTRSTPILAPPPPRRRRIPSSTSSSSATRAPARPSTRCSPTTSRRPRRSRSRSRWSSCCSPSARSSPPACRCCSASPP